MKTKILCTISLLISLQLACKQPESKITGNEQEAGPSSKDVSAKPAEPSATGNECEPGQKLVYEEKDVFSSYTEDIIRGSGVVSFALDVNNRIDFYNMDGTEFGFLSLNEDLTYYTLNMPQKIVARDVKTVYDFASFDFDAEDVATDNDYLIIYLNKEKRKVKKSAVKYTYSNWKDYLTGNIVTLKACNLLKDASGKTIDNSKSQIFTVLAVKNDMIHIKSSSDCMAMADSDIYRPMEGWLRWKSRNNLTVDFSDCE